MSFGEDVARADVDPDLVASSREIVGHKEDRDVRSAERLRPTGDPAYRNRRTGQVRHDEEDLDGGAGGALRAYRHT